MAKPILEALRLIFEEELAQVPFRPYTLLSILTKRNAFQRAIKWNANVGGANTGGRATTADAGANNNGDVVKPAELPIGGWATTHTFSVLLTEIKELGTDQIAIPALRNLFQSELRTGIDVILPKLNQVLYIGDGTLDTTNHGVVGLAAVTDNASAYAGIDPAVDTDWVSTVLDNAGTPRALTRDLMSQVEIAVARSGAPYDTIVTTPEMVQAYGKLFSLDRNLTISQVNGVADLNFSGYNWGGRPILTDIDCPNGEMYFLNSGQCQFYSYDLSGSNPEIAVTKNMENTMGIQYMIAQLPSNNPHAIKFEISVIPQMKVHNRKFVAVVKDLNETLSAYV